MLDLHITKMDGARLIRAPSVFVRAWLQFYCSFYICKNNMCKYPGTKFHIAIRKELGYNKEQQAGDDFFKKDKEGVLIENRISKLYFS